MSTRLFKECSTHSGIGSELLLINPGLTTVLRENATYSSAVVMHTVRIQLEDLLCLIFWGDICTHVVHLHGIFTGLAVSTKRISRTKSCPYAGASVQTRNTRCFSPPTSRSSHLKTRVQPRQTENCNFKTSLFSSRRCVHTFLSFNTAFVD